MKSSHKPALVIFRGLVALVFSFLLVHYATKPTGEIADRSLPFGYEQIQVHAGSTRDIKDGALVSAAGATAQILISWRTNFPADRYVFADIYASVSGGQNEWVLFWRRAEEKQRVYSTELFNGFGGRVTLRMDRLTEWKGRITEIGLAVRGPEGPQLRLHEVELVGYSAFSHAWALVSEWSARRAWNMQSINFLGSSLGDKGGISLVQFGALWAVLLLVMEIGFNQTVRRNPLPAVAGIALASWCLVDTFWSVQLWRQAGADIQRLAGHGLHEKRRLAQDGPLYAQAQEVLQHMPKAPQRVYLIVPDPSGSDRYKRLRLRWHFLPHNVFAYANTIPKPGHVKKGDFIMVVGNNPFIRFEKERSTLRAGAKSTRIPVDSVAEVQLGRLYRVSGSQYEATNDP